MLHLERGAPDEWSREREERHVECQTARWLLPHVPVIKEAIEQHGLTRAARLLKVPQSLLVLRLRNLTEQETHLLHG
jgi:hypothetical protein